MLLLLLLHIALPQPTTRTRVSASQPLINMRWECCNTALQVDIAIYSGLQQQTMCRPWIATDLGQEV